MGVSIFCPGEVPKRPTKTALGNQAIPAWGNRAKNGEIGEKLSSKPLTKRWKTRRPKTDQTIRLFGKKIAKKNRFF